MRIITVAYRNGDQVCALLDSLLKFVEIPAEVIVWDNGGDAHAEIERWRSQNRSLPFDLTLAGTGANLGFARAMNRAVALPSDKDFDDLLILNPDSVLASPLTPAIAQRLRSFQGIVGLRVFDDAGKQRRQASARRFPSFWTALTGREGLLTRLWPRNPWSQRYLGAQLDANFDQPVDWVSGCAFFISRRQWDQLKGFDESYFLYVEDVDLGRKAKRAGVPVFFCPAVDVVHLSRGSASKRFWKSDYHHHLGMWIYYVKWSGPLGFIFSPLVFAAIGTRFFARRLLGPKL